MASAPDQETPDVPGVIAKPPFIYGTALLLGAILHFAIPLTVSITTAVRLFGSILLICGLGGVVRSIQELRRAGTTEKVSQPTTAFVDTGPYRRSRNPIYVSLTLLYAGIGVCVNSTWILLLLPAVLLMMRYGVVAREERYLEGKFSEEYRAYCRRVRRWV